jgi:hypothetical protein
MYDYFFYLSCIMMRTFDLIQASVFLEGGCEWLVVASGRPNNNVLVSAMLMIGCCTNGVVLGWNWREESPHMVEHLGLLWGCDRNQHELFFFGNNVQI